MSIWVGIWLYVHIFLCLKPLFHLAARQGPLPDKLIWENAHFNRAYAVYMYSNKVKLEVFSLNDLHDVHIALYHYIHVYGTGGYTEKTDEFLASTMNIKGGGEWRRNLSTGSIPKGLEIVNKHLALGPTGLGREQREWLG